MAHWIQTYSKRTFRLDGPDHRDVQLGDISHALASICRFNGHTLWRDESRFPYSVAQHSVLVSRIVERITDIQAERYAGLNLPLLALLHDAHEAYVGDMATPMKELLGDAWTRIEERAEEAVRMHFQLTVRPSQLPIVKEADRIALATEARDLLAGGPIGWTCELPEPDALHIVPISASAARELFLTRYWELDREFALTGKRGA